MSKVTVTVSAKTGSGKSAICGEIEIALKAVGVSVTWAKADREHWTHGNEYWLDLYKPEVEIIEKNISRKASLIERLRACWSDEEEIAYQAGWNDALASLKHPPSNAVKPQREG